MSNATLLPPNTTALERHAAQVNGGISDLDTPLRDLWRPDTCPAHLLPWLAWALSVDEWDAKWSENRQRRAIKAAIGVHRRKGTIGAVKRALAAIDYDVSLIEWHQDEPPGAPYTFRAEAIIEDRGLDAATQAEIIRLINAAKNARSHLTKLRLIGSLKGQVYLTGWEQSFDTVSVLPLQITEAEVPPTPYYLGATTTAYDTTTVQPL